MQKAGGWVTWGPSRLRLCFFFSHEPTKRMHSCVRLLLGTGTAKKAGATAHACRPGPSIHRACREAWPCSGHRCGTVTTARGGCSKTRAWKRGPSGCMPGSRPPLSPSPRQRQNTSRRRPRTHRDRGQQPWRRCLHLHGPKLVGAASPRARHCWSRRREQGHCFEEQSVPQTWGDALVEGTRRRVWCWMLGCRQWRVVNG